MSEINRIFFPLIRSSVSGEPLGDGETALFSRELLPELVRLAGRHDITAMLATSLINNNLIARDSRGATDEITKAVYRYEILCRELDAVCELFGKECIAHIPLKGAVMRKYYPQPYMRTSSDIDILVYKEEVEKAVGVLTASGYTISSRTAHDVSLRSKLNQLLELHFDLIEVGGVGRADSVLGSVWESSSPTPGFKYRYEMSDEMFYFYHIAHMAKHFESGGCGIRPFIYLYLLDAQGECLSQRNALLEKGGLFTFAEAARKLSRTWLADCEPSQLSLRMQEYILSGGMYGSVENRINSRQKRSGGKLRYLLSRIFAPYSKLAGYYPVLHKHPWLMPVMQVRRWITLLNPNKAKRAAAELRANKNANADNIDNTQSLLDELGI